MKYAVDPKLLFEAVEIINNLVRGGAYIHLYDKDGNDFSPKSEVSGIIFMPEEGEDVW